MTDADKAEIDNMSYQSMLSQWRKTPVGHVLFQGERGKYFAEVMAKKRKEVGGAEHVRASKAIGWEG